MVRGRRWTAEEETMRMLRTHGSLVVSLLILALVSLPSVGLADDDNDSKKHKKDSDKQQEQITQNADLRPDLQIKYAGFSPPNLQHTVTFEVTNIGKASSTAIKAQIQTLKGGP